MILKQSKYFKLKEMRNLKKPGSKRWFEIELDYYGSRFTPGGIDRVESIVDYFGTCYRRSTWRYWKREEAEKHLTYAIMRWE